jgi:tetratricopeptide (TPR) repeat protein
MLLDLTGFKITQTSAKDGNREIGVRAHDAGHIELLAFLFLTPEYKSQTAATCLQQDLIQVRKDGGKFVEQLNPSHADNGETATILLTYPNGHEVLYKYAGMADQCLVIQVYADKDSKLNLSDASALLERQHYDPRYVPITADVLRYQQIRGQVIAVSGKPASNTLTPRMLVTWHGPGGIPLPQNAEWKLTLLTAYNNAARPVAEFKNDATNVIISFIISENLSGKPTAEGCRKDIISGILKENGQLISNQSEGELSDGHGGKFATSSHFTQLSGALHNHDVFVFAGDAKTCAEAHASTVSGKPDEDKRLADALALFRPDLSFRPDSSDYFTLASAFYKQSPMLGAPFFDASVKAMPADIANPELITRRRMATDNIVIALGTSGNLKGSRAYAQRAIKSDPDYPLNYYNLACADAEEGKATDAKLHLQQAFDRKANTIPGEHLPDPTKDDSILKLKNDKTFWAFVETLSAAN